MIGGHVFAGGEIEIDIRVGIDGEYPIMNCSRTSFDIVCCLQRCRRYGTDRNKQHNPQYALHINPRVEHARSVPAQNQCVIA
jgi:hypothetical protein